MKTESEIEDDVKNELDRESFMVASTININVKRGHVTLEGVADSYAKKIESERAALRVEGVTGVSNNIVLKIGNRRSDEDIKKTTIKVITWNSLIDENRINVKVEKGWVTLTGEVDYEYQKSKATFLTEDIVGVVGVTNHINVISSLDSSGNKLSA